DGSLARHTMTTIVRRARHAPIGDPHPTDYPVARLHRGHNGLHRAHIAGVAREDLVAEREAIEAHHQGDTHLFAVGAVIARVAALGERVPQRLAFEERARHIVE